MILIWPNLLKTEITIFGVGETRWNWIKLSQDKRVYRHRSKIIYKTSRHLERKMKSAIQLCDRWSWWNIRKCEIRWVWLGNFDNRSAVSQTVYVEIGLVMETTRLKWLLHLESIFAMAIFLENWRRFFTHILYRSERNPPSFLLLSPGVTGDAGLSYCCTLVVWSSISVRKVPRDVGILQCSFHEDYAKCS